MIKTSGLILANILVLTINAQNLKTGIDKDRFSVRNDFTNYFDSCNVKGSIAIYDNNKSEWIFSDTTDAMKETVPASTFKIINLLIALETKVISSLRSSGFGV